MNINICVLMLTVINEKLCLKEYIQGEDRSVEPTENTYPMYVLAKELRVSKNKMVTKENYTTANVDVYQFAFSEKNEVSTDSLKQYNQMVVILPKQIKKDYAEDSKLIAFQKMLDVFSDKVKIRKITPKKGKKFSLQKKKKYIGNIAVALTVATAIGLFIATYQKVSDYKAEQKRQKDWKAFEQLLNPTEEPTIQQLQEEYHQSQLDYIDLRLQEQVEENKRTRGMQ